MKFRSGTYRINNPIIKIKEQRPLPLFKKGGKLVLVIMGVVM
jgi:hypothetical protein